MIFVGIGALLRRAILHTIECKYHIDIVFSNSLEVVQCCKENNIPYKRFVNINDQISDFKSEDKIVLSINNNQIFKKDILSLPGFRFYNIHNGIIPEYRGRPEICIIYAILKNEKVYGVTLHTIDQGIDTGICHAFKMFEITEEDTFESVMQKSLENCEVVFIKYLDNIIKDNLEEISKNGRKSKLYTYRDLEILKKEYDPTLVSRVLYFGIFHMWFAPAIEILERQIKTG
jgi:methionyl-tRNA formyltransferase